MEEAKAIDPIKEISSIIGLSFELAVFFTLAIVGNKKGYFFPYKPDVLKEFGEACKLSVESGDHLKYLDWCSRNYDFYRRHTALINPFILYPVVNSEENPVPDEGHAYIIVSYNSLYHKMTSGIYFSLIDKFNRGKKDNIFKTAFGYVFQEYIGVLLNEHLKGWRIVKEIKYKKGKNRVDSVDWFALKQDRLILIEVKQSSVFLKSKTTASLNDLKEDLKKTIFKGIEQIVNTKEAITSGTVPEFEEFNGVKHFQCLIVTHDPFYNANGFGRDLVNAHFGKKIEFNIISVSDFEVLLDNQAPSSSLFDLLEFKNLNHDHFDFKEFMIEMFPDGNSGMGFLRKYYDDYLSRIRD